MGGQIIEIHGEPDFRAKLSQAGHRLVVVDFTASWCGPCQAIKPVFESLSATHKDVMFLKVDGDENQDLCISLGIQGFPTFHFYIQGVKKHQIVGANRAELEEKIKQLKSETGPRFGGEGKSLGSVTAALDPRQARLARFAAEASVKGESAAGALTSTDVDIVPTLKASTELSQATTAISPVHETSMSGQHNKSNPELLQQLLDMGFPQNRACRAIQSGASDLEMCVNWLADHEDDVDMDPDLHSSGQGEDGMTAITASSLVCNDCGMKFADSESAQRHAVRKGHTDFSESTESAPLKTVLTEEQKQAKLEELKQKLAARRAEREVVEKVESATREIDRRAQGKAAGRMKEELDQMQRKREADRMRKEKEAQQKERQRLLAQIELDRRERAAHGGKLPGLNYEPSTTPADIPRAAPEKSLHSPKNPREQVLDCIDKLQQYRVGGDGLIALKTLTIYVKNILEHPAEEKFRTIKLDNRAFKTRVASLVGGVALLKAIGFDKSSDGSVLELKADARDEDLLKFALTSLQSTVANLTS